MASDPEPQVRITLRHAGGGWDGDGPLSVRLRLALKVLLRRFGLRCVEIQWLPPAKGEEVTDDGDR